MNKRIYIEGFSCGEIMSFDITEDGEFINLDNCSIADIESSAIRVQSNNPITEDGRIDF